MGSFTGPDCRSGPDPAAIVSGGSGAAPCLHASWDILRALRNLGPVVLTAPALGSRRQIRFALQTLPLRISHEVGTVDVETTRPQKQLSTAADVHFAMAQQDIRVTSTVCCCMVRRHPQCCHRRPPPGVSARSGESGRVAMSCQANRPEPWLLATTRPVLCRSSPQILVSFG